MSSSAVPRASRWRLIAALFSVYVVWGSTYLAMRFAVEGLPPLLMAGVRFTIAGLALGGFLVARGARLPTAGQWLRAVPIGVLLFVCGNGFVALGERDIGSGLAAVVVATMPLWMAIMLSVSGERPSGREVAGLLLGLVGVLVLSGEAELVASPVGAMFLFLAPAAWALGSVLARRLDLPAGLMAPVTQMLTGGVIALAVGFAIGERFSATPPVRALLATAYLIVFGSLIAFSAYAWLLANTRPALATSYAFVNPIIAVILGAVLANETFGWQTAAAIPLVVAAVALVITGRARGGVGSRPTTPLVIDDEA